MLFLSANKIIGDGCMYDMNVRSMLLAATNKIFKNTNRTTQVLDSYVRIVYVVGGGIFVKLKL